MSDKPSSSPAVSEAFRRELDLASEDAGLAAITNPAARPPPVPPLGRRRRPGGPLVDDEIGFLTLVNVDGVLEWREGLQPPQAAGRRARFGAPAAVGEVVDHFSFEKLPPSDVTTFIDKLDLRLTPDQGLFRVAADGQLQPVEKAPGDAKRILLLVHGTFSKPEALVGGLLETQPGKEFFAAAFERYDKQIYAFGHPTLAVTPLENALDLAGFFHSSQATVDVISHSRGGLITRWWFEKVARGAMQPGRAVLVGSPLAGTSLAAPPRLRATLKLFTNIANVLGATAGAASAVMPFLTVATGLMKVVATFTSVLASTPVADALVAVVPGLMGQSRVGNNPGLLRLRKAFPSAQAPDYRMITADFEPTAPGWKFWKFFTSPKKHGLDFVADQIFDGPNDLVVDTASMTSLADEFVLPHERCLKLKTGDVVHHTNYFQQPEVIRFLDEQLLKRKSS